nr:hypothetical protein [Streptomyces sp. TLI_235]
MKGDLHALPTHLYPVPLYGGPALPDRRVKGTRTRTGRGRLASPSGFRLPNMPGRRVPVRAYVGPGGCGKTLLALGQSYSGGHNWDPYLWSYTDIRWVSARDEASLEAGLMNFLRHLHRPAEPPPPGDGAASLEDLVLNRLHAPTWRWLLILDGLDDPDLLQRVQAPGGILRERTPPFP